MEIFTWFALRYASPDMQRRDLLKRVPTGIAVAAGQVSLADAQTSGDGIEAVYNVRNFGARDDGKTVDTAAINKAIEEAAARGGGTVVLPAGTYLCFTIRLKSSVDLYLPHGCTIQAADSPRPGETTGYNGGTYDSAESNDPWTACQDYGHNHWRNSLFLRLNRRNRNPKETVRPGTLRRVLISNLVSYNSASSTASIFSGIRSNLIEDVKLSSCYFGHGGLPKLMRVNWGEATRPMPDWRTIRVPEKEEAYPELLQFGPTPSHGFFIRHLRNLEMSHVEIAPTNPDPRPAFWLEDVHRADFLAVTAPQQGNFSLHNVTDFRVGWSRAAKDTNRARANGEVV